MVRGSSGGIAGLSGVMADGAQTRDLLSRGQARSADREVIEAGSHRHEMIPARTMTALAADPAVACLGTLRSMAARMLVTWQSTHFATESGERYWPITSSGSDWRGEARWA